MRDAASVSADRGGHHGAAGRRSHRRRQLTELLAAIDAGERADGHPYTFNGEPIPPLSGLPIARDRHERRPGVPPPAVAIRTSRSSCSPSASTGSSPSCSIRTSSRASSARSRSCWRFIGSNALPLNVGGLLLVLIGVGLLALEVVVASYGLLTVGRHRRARPRRLRAVDRRRSLKACSIDVSVSPWIVAVVAAVGVAYAWVIVRALLQMRRDGRHREPAGGRAGRGGRHGADGHRADGHRLC